MSKTDDSHHDTNDESEDEPDEDPKLMLLVEAGLVPGLDDNLQHLKRRHKKKKMKRIKKNKRRRESEGDTHPNKKPKRDYLHEEYVISRIVAHLNKPSKVEAYQNCLMMSEWFVKVPDDFDENWITVFCPTGKRMLVVASSAITKSFSKSGDFMFYFQSALPGGHEVAKDESSKSLTILDCIWNHKNQTYYVLDLFSWNTSHLLNCEANFRFFWLQQKLTELGSKLDVSERNHYRFSCLPRFQCKKDKIVDALSSICRQEEFVGNIDGFLFYNVKAPYFSGESSSVGWLKPFMVSEVFGVPLVPELQASCPDDFVSVEQYIKEFEENKKQIMKKERKMRQNFLKKLMLAFVKDEANSDVDMEVAVEEKVSQKECVRIEDETVSKNELVRVEDETVSETELVRVEDEIALKEAIKHENCVNSKNEIQT